jgi:hypothetical protein
MEKMIITCGGRIKAPCCQAKSNRTKVQSGLAAARGKRVLFATAPRLEQTKIMEEATQTEAVVSIAQVEKGRDLRSGINYTFQLYSSSNCC